MRHLWRELKSGRTSGTARINPVFAKQKSGWGGKDMDKRANKTFLLRSEQGATLVEVLISVMILSVVIVGTVALFARCSVFAAEIKNHAIVNNALNEEMEVIRGLAYSSITSLSSTFTGTGFSLLHNATGTATVDDPFSNSDIRRVTLTVSWNTPQGKSMTKSLTAYFTNSGINQQ